MGIFPVTTDLSGISAEGNRQRGLPAKSFLFNFGKGDFVLLDGKMQVAEDIAALKVWIEKILRTKRDEYKIYEGTPYGSRLDDLLIGTYPTAFIDSELRREVEEALTQHPQIVTISEFEVDRSSSNCVISFVVTLASGVTFGEAIDLV